MTVTSLWNSRDNAALTTETTFNMALILATLTVGSYYVINDSILHPYFTILRYYIK